MKKFKILLTLMLLLYVAVSDAAVVSLITRLGYSPEIGGSMSSGWQQSNLGVRDGINDINRSGGGFAVSTVESPLGVIAGADLRVISGNFYWKAGAEYIYQYSGGTGKTIDPSGSEIVEVEYKQWSLDAPLTIGLSIIFWGESRLYIGGGAAFAYGSYSNSFKAATAALNHSESFTGYAVPLVAEFGCEYLVNESVSLGCDVRYLYGKSAVIEDGSDYARIDFTAFHITAVLSYNFNI